MKKSKKKISSEEFDKRFDAGEDMGDYLAARKAKVSRHIHRVNIDFPESFLKIIDDEAHKIGVARTALIKIWVAERLESIHH